MLCPPFRFSPHAPMEQKSFENLLENLCSLSAQKYFWLEEPEIIIKIL